MNLDKAIKTRKSVRKFTLDKPDWRKIIRAIDAVRFAPMAGNYFSSHFILIKDPKIIKEIKEACQQEFVGEAHYLVVVVSDDTQLKKLYDDKAEKFARQQAGAAIENFLLALHSLGLSTCWVGWYEESQVKRAIGIRDNDPNLVVEALFPIGKESKVKAGQRPKKPDLERYIYFDKFGNKFFDPKTRVSIESV